MNDLTLQEVEEIKVKIYNETKNMTWEESRAYIRKDVLKAAEKYGFTLRFVKNRGIKLSADADTKD